MNRITKLMEDEETGAKRIAFRVPSGIVVCPDVTLRPDYYFALNRLYELENEMELINKRLAKAEQTIDTVQEQFNRGTFYDSYIDQAISEWEAFSNDCM